MWRHLELRVFRTTRGSRTERHPLPLLTCPLACRIERLNGFLQVSLHFVPPPQAREVRKLDGDSTCAHRVDERPCVVGSAQRHAGLVDGGPVLVFAKPRDVRVAVVPVVEPAPATLRPPHRGTTAR